MSARTEVGVIGVGLTTCLGEGISANLAGLARGEGNYRNHTLNNFTEPLQGTFLTCRPELEAATVRQRMHHMLDTALDEALQGANLNSTQVREIPVFIGSSSYGIALAEDIYAKSLRSSQKEDSIATPVSGFHQIGEHLQNQHGLLGPDYSFNTACTASANAVLAAVQAIRTGGAQYALVVGFEMFNLTTLAGFAGMQLLASEVMRPFDLRRNGLVLGEGCAVLLLHAAELKNEGIILCGGASETDTYSISTADPNGSSIKSVMQRAMQDSGVTAKDIKAIKAHGTATPMNDIAEAAGMNAVFQPLPPFFCLKPYVGHTLGACGAVELALMAATLGVGELPASAGFERPDPVLQAQPITASTNAPPGYYMLNYFGFGGNNCSLILHWEYRPRGSCQATPHAT
jgi:3-oxoacyl-(acyl-carrier-protein) synthase